MINNITAITAKIPKPIPALKIPSIAAHELIKLEINTHKKTQIIVGYFIVLEF